MKKAITFSFFVFCTLIFSSCKNDSFYEDKIFAGGKYVKKETLNKGKAIYQEYCMACHGEKGDGKGVASKGMKVPPRDFTLGVYKFGHVLSGELPHDEDFYEILDKGLHGTAMLPWDLGQGQKDAVVQYIKTFAPKVWEGKDKQLGERIVPTKDPYGLAHKQNAIEKGKEVYHITASCQTCHKAYATYDEMNKMSVKINGDRMTDFPEDLYKIKLQDSEHGYPTMPPDFLRHEVRSARTVEELYIRIAAGVGGTAMPSWKGSVTEDGLWALSHYVKYLMDLKDNEAERKALMSKLEDQRRR